MRTRAGVVLIENDKVALIERHRAGLVYYVFPGGGVDKGEAPQQAAVREALEELGIQIVIKQQVAMIHFSQSTQIYYLVESVGGEFGTGTGEEFTNSDPNDSGENVYIPVWMPIGEMPQHEKVFPAAVADLVLKAKADGFPKEPIEVDERSQ